MSFKLIVAIEHNSTWLNRYKHVFDDVLAMGFWQSLQDHANKLCDAIRFTRHSNLRESYTFTTMISVCG